MNTQQITAAFEACRRLHLAYARASEDNGGNSSVLWEDIDHALEAATEALGAEALLANNQRPNLENIEGGEAEDFY